MKRQCLALDLIDDPELIKEYEAYHRNVWPEILRSIRESGILEMEIYRIGNRLFMILDTNESFNATEKTKMDNEKVKIQEWEKLMWNYQKALPMAKPGEKWLLMDRIFKLSEQ